MKCETSDCYKGPRIKVFVPESPEARAVARATFKYVLASDVPDCKRFVGWLDD